MLLRGHPYVDAYPPFKSGSHLDLSTVDYGIMHINGTSEKFMH